MTVTTKRGHVLSPIGREPPADRPDGVTLICTARNEALRLPYFLRYHREMGVDRFLVVDNGSDDGTADLLADEPGVFVHHTAASYADSGHGVEWINALADRYVTEGWVLALDADELLVYPGCEETDLVTLTSELDRRGATGLLTFLLDMYANVPIAETHYVAGTSFVDRCPYFDVDTYEYRRFGRGRTVPSRGGPRRRLFWSDPAVSSGNPPVLAKIPLVRWTASTEFLASTHDVSGVRLARTTGALLHFKLFSDFVEKVRAEVVRGEHWDDAAQYRSYLAGIDQLPTLTAHHDGSVRYVDSAQLERLGLIRRPGLRWRRTRERGRHRT